MPPSPSVPGRAEGAGAVGVLAALAERQRPGQVGATVLVEVYAAGPEALARRARLQGRVVDLLVDELGFGDERRVACYLVVAGTAALVTPLLVQGDLDGVRALRGPLVEVVSRLLA